MDEAEKISISLEQAVEWMLDKLCEDYPEDVRRTAWSLFSTRIGIANGDWPTLDEI